MKDPKTPQGDIPALYALAANHDKAAALKLIGLYNNYIKETAINLRSKYRVRAEIEDLVQEGVCGLLDSLKTLEMNLSFPTYSAWIEKNIKSAIAGMIHAELQAKGIDRAPDEL